MLILSDVFYTFMVIMEVPILPGLWLISKTYILMARRFSRRRLLRGLVLGLGANHSDNTGKLNKSFSVLIFYNLA